MNQISIKTGILFFSALVVVVVRCPAQYYYKDIVANRQAQAAWKSLRDNKVRRVELKSIERDGQPTPGFVCAQNCAADFTSVTTFTESEGSAPSVLVSFYDGAGRLRRTVDSSDVYSSTTDYQYDPNGQVTAIRNGALQTDNQLRTTEDHFWYYRNGTPVRMLKVKGGVDTTLVTFKTDEKGNVTEESAVHGSETLPAVYYYYDGDNRLTDIVRFNQKARRLLPDYIFEYVSGQAASMIFVPGNTGDYQKWVYEYDAKNLKVRETCYNKKKNIVARIDYTYRFQ